MLHAPPRVRRLSSNFCMSWTLGSPGSPCSGTGTTAAGISLLPHVGSSSLPVHLEMTEAHRSFSRTVPGLAPPLLFLGGTQPKVPGMACMGAGRNAGLVWHLGDGLRCSLGLLGSETPSESCCENPQLKGPSNRGPSDSCLWGCPSWIDQGAILWTCSEAALAVASHCDWYCCCCCSCCCFCCCAGWPNCRIRGTIFGAFGGSHDSGSANSRGRVQRTWRRLDVVTVVARCLHLTGDSEEPRVLSWLPASCIDPCRCLGEPGKPRTAARCSV